MTRQRNPRGEGGRLKDELIDAALRLLDKRPGVQLSLRMVAMEAGGAAPSVYRHFPDVRAMTMAIVQECWALMAEQIRKAGNDARPATPLDELKAKMTAYVRYAMERPSRYQLLFDFSGGFSEDLDGPIRPAYRAVLESIEAISGSGKALPVPVPVSTTLLVISLAHGRIALAHLAPRRPGNFMAGIEAFVLEALEFLFKD